MSDIEQIEQSIQGLSPEELAQFRAWFVEFDARVWDKQIEDDQRTGKLEKLVAEGRADYKAGKARGL